LINEIGDVLFHFDFYWSSQGRIWVHGPIGTTFDPVTQAGGPPILDFHHSSYYPVSSPITPLIVDSPYRQRSCRKNNNAHNLEV